MKKVLFTQRVDVIESYGERRDCADQNIAKFIAACGFLPIPVVNNPLIIESFCKFVEPDGVFFSGGNDLTSYGGNAPERDETEKYLIKYAENYNIPVFGICRGMQMIADYYGTKLEKVEKHIRVNHRITGRISRDAVNSFHGLGIRSITAPLTELARSEDGVVEAIKHEDYRIAAIMWHPERANVFSQEDIILVSNFYNGGNFV